jgi:hypothetical protein
MQFGHFKDKKQAAIAVARAKAAGLYLLSKAQIRHAPSPTAEVCAQIPRFACQSPFRVFSHVGGVMVTYACAYRCVLDLSASRAQILSGSLHFLSDFRRWGSRRVDIEPRCRPWTRGCACQGAAFGQPRKRCSSNPAPHLLSEHA